MWFNSNVSDFYKYISKLIVWIHHYKTIYNLPRLGQPGFPGEKGEQGATIPVNKY